MTDTMLCLVRHGATDWNYDMRMQGQFDQPLNEEGRRQAQQVAERLGDLPWDAIYASDLSRARDTAEAIARKVGLPVHLEPGLRERSMGLLEGWTLRERRQRYPSVSWSDLPGFENDGDLGARAIATFRKIAEAHRGQRVVCVSHGALLGVFLELISGGEVKVRHRNTAVSFVHWDGRTFRPEQLPDHSHILETSGLEYTGERGRATPRALRALYAAAGMQEAEWEDDRLQTMVELSASGWSAWNGDQMVAFARAVTDTVATGVIDRCAVHPDYEKSPVLADLVERIKRRFPGVEWVE